MKNLEAIRAAGQEQLNYLVDLGKEQPAEVKTWGVTAGAAVAGSLVLTAGAQGLLAIVATLASLPVSLTVGAIGGGVLGWLYMEQRKTANPVSAVDQAPLPDPVPQAITITMDAPADASSDDAISLSQASEPLLITPEIAIASKPAAAVVDATSNASHPQQDKLEEIVGIGPVFAARLQSVGIHSFTQLAALSPEPLLEIMASSRGGHLVDAAAWIEQARQLAAVAAV